MLKIILLSLITIYFSGCVIYSDKTKTKKLNSEENSTKNFILFTEE